MRPIGYDPRVSRYDNKHLEDKPLFNNAFVNKGVNTKYFSGIDAEIYFEDVYIDDIVQIQFSVQQNAMPLVGYNSYVYDDIAVGSRLIQGQFVINFTRSDYLFQTLNVLKQVTSIGASKKEVMTEEQRSYQEHVQSQKRKNDMLDRTQSSVNQWKKSPLWNKRFNIVISYGDYTSYDNNNQFGTLLVLEGVQLTGCSQGFGASGEPITELYTFIARDMQIRPSTMSSLNPQVQTEQSNAAKVNRGMKITKAIYSEKIVAGDPASFIDVDIDLNGYEPESIEMFVDIPLEDSNANISYDVFMDYNKGSISYRLEEDLRNLVRKYECNVLKRPFDVTFVILTKNTEGEDVKVKLATPVSIQNIEK